MPRPHYDFLTNLVAFSILGAILWFVSFLWSFIQRRGKLRTPAPSQPEAVKTPHVESVPHSEPTNISSRTTVGPIRTFGRWLRSSNGLIVVGVGILVAGLKGFQLSEVPDWLSSRDDPAYRDSYESIVIAASGAMMIAAGIVKRLARRE